MSDNAIVAAFLAAVVLLTIIGIVTMLRAEKSENKKHTARHQVQTSQHPLFGTHERLREHRGREVVPEYPRDTNAMLAEEVWEILARAREPLSARAIRKRMRVRQIIPDHAIPNLDNIGTVIERALEQHPEIEQVTKQRVAMYTLGHRAAVVRAKRRVRPEVVVARATEIEREYRRITVASSESAGYIE